MKKIFTLFTFVLLSCMSIAKADTVAVNIYDENEKEYKGYDVELTKDSQGVYTMSNFINTGCPLSFSFDSSVALNDYTTVSLKGSNLYNYDGYYYVLDSSGNYAVGTIYDLTGDGSTMVDSPYLYVKSTSYSYVTRVDKATYGYEYYASINFSGYDEKENYLLDYYIDFGFNAIGDDVSGEDPDDPADEESVSLGDVTVKVCNSKEVEIAKSFTTELSVNGKNVYTLADFLNSGAPLSFSFDSDVAVGSNSAITLSKNVELSYSYYYYVLDSDEGYSNAKIYPLEGDAATDLYSFYVYNTSSSKSYTYLKHLDKAEAGYDYCARFTVSGYDANNKDADWYYLYMYFNAPEKSGLSVVAAEDENAPVEYYNLNGLRVENPANGIFIRKQGSKVEKVVIR